jgi:hypothetical protein
MGHLSPNLKYQSNQIYLGETATLAKDIPADLSWLPQALGEVLIVLSMDARDSVDLKFGKIHMNRH